eukprot:1017963-Pleurochrysis_carterae.AAC.3
MNLNRARQRVKRVYSCAPACARVRACVRTYALVRVHASVHLCISAFVASLVSPCAGERCLDEHARALLIRYVYMRVSTCMSSRKDEGNGSSFEAII